MDGDKVVELISLWEELKNCEKCFRPQEKQQTIPGTGKLSPFIALVNHHVIPEGARTPREKVLGVRNMSAYEKMLQTIGITWEQVWCTSCVKCIGRRGPGLTVACKQYLERELSFVKPKLIIVLGEEAFHIMLNDERKLMEWTPNREYNLNGRKIVAMVSPETIVSNPRYERYWANAAKIVKQHMMQPTLEWW